MRSLTLMILVLGLVCICNFAMATDLVEDFEKGLDNWVVVDEPADLLSDIGPSNWVIQPGPFNKNALNQTTNIWGDPGDIVALGSFIIYDKAEFTDFDLTVDMQANDNDGWGIIFGWKSRTDHYRFFTMADGGNPGGAAGNQGDPGKAPWSLLEKRTSDEIPYYKTLKVERESAYQQGLAVTFRLVVSGGNLQVYADKKLKVEAKDPTYTGGKIGFTVYAESGVFVDNLKILDTSPVEPKSKLASTWGSIKSSK